MLTDPVVEDVPRVQPERGTDQHRHRRAVEPQPDEELGQAARRVPGAQLLEGCEVLQGDGAVQWAHAPIVGSALSPTKSQS